MLKQIVISYKICSIEYFMDKMTISECDVICSMINFSDRTSWECGRLISYLIAQVNSRKKMKPSDILLFPWDDEYKLKHHEHQEEHLTDAEHETLKRNAEIMRKLLFDKSEVKPDNINNGQ